MALSGEAGGRDALGTCEAEDPLPRRRLGGGMRIAQRREDPPSSAAPSAPTVKLAEPATSAEGGEAGDGRIPRRARPRPPLR